MQIQGVFVERHIISIKLMSFIGIQRADLTVQGEEMGSSKNLFAKT